MAFPIRIGLTTKFGPDNNGAGGGQAPFQPVKAAPSGFVYDHSTNAWTAAAITGTSQLSTPGLIPIFGGDDGALTLGATGLVTYPVASAISGTTDFTIAALATVTNADALYPYQDINALRCELHVDGQNDELDVAVAGTNIIQLTHAGINDGRVHLYTLRRTSGLVELAVDGAVVASATKADSINAAGPTSARAAGTPTLDELAWWFSALTDAQITELVSAASIRTGSTGLLSGQWVTKHLADFAFSSTDANIATGSSTIDNPDLSTGDAAAVLAQVAAAEDGMIFIDGAGKLTLIPRNGFGASTATFGDGGVGIQPPEFSYDIDHVANRIQVTKTGSATIVVDDTDSQNDYGIRSMPWSAELLESSQLTEASNWFLARYKQPRLRVDSVQARGLNGFWPTLLGVELGDRITVTVSPPGGGSLSTDVIVEHIEHQISVDDWVVTLQLAPMPNVFILDDPNQGQLAAVTAPAVDSFLGWGEVWPRDFILDDTVQGDLDSGYQLA